MQRILTDHITPGNMNERVRVLAMDKPTSEGGGASHHYELRVDSGPARGVLVVTIPFQHGPIGKPEDVNGLTNEALLAVVIDRLRGFNGHLEAATGVPAGFKSRDNAEALTHLETALLWLKKRTLERMARGVEGTHKA